MCGVDGADGCADIDGQAGGGAAFTADTQVERRADASLDAELHRDRVPIAAGCHPGDAALDQAAQDGGAVRRRAATRVVGDVGENDGAGARGEGGVDSGVDAVVARAGRLAHPPDLLAERACQGLRLRLVAVGDDDHFGADLGHIAPGKAVAEGDGQDAVMAFERLHPGDEGAHRLDRRAPHRDHAAVVIGH